MGRPPPSDSAPRRIYLFGIDRSRLAKIAGKMQLPVNLVNDLNEADLLMITKSHYRKNPQALEVSAAAGIPVYVLRSNTFSQIEQSLADIFDLHEPIDPVALALREAEEAIRDVRGGKNNLELCPQNAYIRRLQHQLADQYKLKSESKGREPQRRVRIFRDTG